MVSFSNPFRATKNVFSKCQQLESLDLVMDTLSSVTGTSFSPLQALKRFSLYRNQRMSPRAIDHLSSLTSLMPLDCRIDSLECIDDTTLSHLQELLELCIGTNISDRGLRHLSCLTFLDICDGRPDITDQALKHMKRLKVLNMCNCRQTSLSDRMFSYLSNLSILKMDGCNQSTITDHAFVYLSQLRWLSVRDCNQLSSDALRHVSRVDVLALNDRQWIKSSTLPRLQTISGFPCRR